MKLWNDLKTMFGKLTLLELASTELAEAERKLMEAHSAEEFAAALVTYEATRITRLRAQINELSKEQQ